MWIKVLNKDTLVTNFDVLTSLYSFSNQSFISSQDFGGNGSIYSRKLFRKYYHNSAIFETLKEKLFVSFTNKGMQQRALEDTEFKKYSQWANDHDFPLLLSNDSLGGVPKEALRDIPREYFEVQAVGEKKARKTLVFNSGQVDFLKDAMYGHAGWFDRIVFYHNNFNGAYREYILDKNEQVICVVVSRYNAEDHFLIIDQKGNASVLMLALSAPVMEAGKIYASTKQNMNQASFPIDTWKSRAHSGNSLFVESFSSLEVHGTD